MLSSHFDKKRLLTCYLCQQSRTAFHLLVGVDLHFYFDTKVRRMRNFLPIRPQVRACSIIPKSNGQGQKKAVFIKIFAYRLLV
jgi:hypothetical protein